MNKLLIALIITFFSINAYAVDNRIVTEVYSPNRVYQIHYTAGKAILIQLEADESLAKSDNALLAMGDVATWDLGVRGNNISFKPKASQTLNTNLIIVTNKRTYTFDLRQVRRGHEIYMMRFRYPDTEAANQKKAIVLAAKKREEKRLKALSRASKRDRNTAFYWKGSNEALKPTAAYDDGRFTHLIYNNAGALPVFYKVMPDGTEALINYHIGSDNKAEVVLHDIVPIIRARLNNAVIEIINRGYKVPEIDRFGTSEVGAVRMGKGEEAGNE